MDLRTFLAGLNEGMEKSPYIDSLQKLNTIMSADASMYAAVRKVASELSGSLIEKIADALQERGMALDGHRIVTGFTPDKNSEVKDE